MKVVCPGCQKGLNVKDEFAGRSGKCPACGAVLTIPEKPAQQHSTGTDRIHPAHPVNPCEVPSSAASVAEAPATQSEDSEAPAEPAAKGVTVCETHEGERIIARCTVCGRGVCGRCRDEFGYYCSDACREKGSRRSLGPTEQEEQRELVEFGRKMDRWLRIAKRRVLPAAAVIVVLVILYRVTSDLGEPIWEFTPPEDIPISQPVLSGETVLACCGNALYAIDARSGGTRWTFEAEKSLSASRPILLAKGLCLTWDAANVYGIDAAEGPAVWKRALPGELKGAPAVGAGVVVTVCDLFREPTREDRWLADKASRDSGRYVDVTRLPSLRTGSVVTAVASQSGKEVWTLPLAEGTFFTGLALGGEPLYLCLRETLVLRSEQPLLRRVAGEAGFRHVLASLDPASGAESWRAEVGGGFFLALIPAGNGVLVASAGGLTCFSSEGEELWKRAGESVFNRPVVAGDRVYCPGERGIECLELAGGKSLWRTDVGGPASRPVVADGLVFVSTYRTEAVKMPEFKGKMKLPQPRAAEGVEDVMERFTAQARPSERAVAVLHAFRAETGESAWTLDGAGGEIICSGERVFAVDARAGSDIVEAAGISTSRVTAIRAQSGKILWEHLHEGSVTGACAGDRAFIFTSRVITSGVSGAFSSRAPVSGHAITAISLTR